MGWTQPELALKATDNFVWESVSSNWLISGYTTQVVNDKYAENQMDKSRNDNGQKRLDSRKDSRSFTESKIGNGCLTDLKQGLFDQTRIEFFAYEITPPFL